tara:strand:- start:4134 stop:5054 length:921 start_codon:yes stop_codon:yes gene_type:complete
MYKKIFIGTRGSKLSIAYAQRVKRLIIASHPKKRLKVSIKKIKTSGDKFKNIKISKIGGKNLFCKEIEDQLEKKKIDVAVHSLKDMETVERKGLTVGAYIKRNDPRDVLILRKKSDLKNLDKKIIGSSSRRRSLQIKLINKRIKVKDIRGNVETRVSKVKKGDYDGTILALAGIKVLKLDKKITSIFSEKKFPPAAGQGIIAAQCRMRDNKIKNILKKINHNQTKICALTEKSLLKSIGGDCHTAVGAFAKIEKNRIRLNAQLFSDNGKIFFEIEKMGNKSRPNYLGSLAGKKLLKLSKGNYRKLR